MSPRELNNTMWDDKFDLTQESVEVCQQKVTIQSNSPSPCKGLPINMVIPCDG